MIMFPPKFRGTRRLPEWEHPKNNNPLQVERAGLLDYRTYTFKPAVQADFSHHVFEHLEVVNNDYDGLGVMYSDIYFPDKVSVLLNLFWVIDVPERMRRLCTVDLHVLTSLDKLVLIMQTIFTFLQNKLS